MNQKIFNATMSVGLAVAAMEYFKIDHGFDRVLDVFVAGYFVVVGVRWYLENRRDKRKP